MLTELQYQTLMFVDRGIKTNGFAPTLEEIRKGLDLKARSHVHAILEELVARGFIRRIPNKRRAIEIVRLPANAALNVTTALRVAVGCILHLEIDTKQADSLLGAFKARGFDVCGVSGPAGRYWDKPNMNELDARLRQVLADSRVPAEDQSSVLHRLASDADALAVDQHPEL